MPIARLAVALVSIAVVTVATVPDPAGAATGDTITASRQHVLQSDAVTLSGRAHGHAVTIDRSVGGGQFRPYLRVGVHAGRYRVTVHPPAGTQAQYRVPGGAQADVTSTACAPLPRHGTVAAWFNVRGRPSAVARQWGEAICSAAPGASITLASMFIYGGSPSADGLAADLRAVAAYRHVHVDVIAQRSDFTSAQQAQLRQAFSFATLHECAYGCTEPGTTGSMHMKYMTISKTVFGGSAVVESSLNWSPQQFDRQNGSAIYFYDDRPLYAAYAAETSRLVHRVPATPQSVRTRWTGAGRGVAYAFDPSATTSDPVVTELDSLPACRRGDYVEIINTNVTRGRFVRRLNQLRAQGCAVRVLVEHLFRPPKVDYAIRHMTTHDKFVLVHVGGVDEVISGSENYRPASMTLCEEQLVRVRVPSVVRAFATWFTTEWSSAAPPHPNRRGIAE